MSPDGRGWNFFYRLVFRLCLAFNITSTSDSESGAKSACDVGSFYTCSRAQFDLMVKGSGIRELRY
jgi:hypothetical protein